MLNQSKFIQNNQKYSLDSNCITFYKLNNYLSYNNIYILFKKNIF